MAKFNAVAIATAVVLFCLFSVSLTRTLPQNSDDTTAVTLPLADGVKADTTAVTLPLADGVKAEDSDTATAIVTADPLIESTFRPINHYFHVISEHACSHHFKVDPTMREFMEISDGNDMIVSSGETGDFEDEDSDSDRDSDSDDDEDDHDRIEFEGYNRFDRKKLKALKKIQKNFRRQNEEEEKQKNGGLLRRVRQFLDLYF